MQQDGRLGKEGEQQETEELQVKALFLYFMPLIKCQLKQHGIFTFCLAITPPSLSQATLFNMAHTTGDHSTVSVSCQYQLLVLVGGMSATQKNPNNLPFEFLLPEAALTPSELLIVNCVVYLTARVPA